MRISWIRQSFAGEIFQGFSLGPHPVSIYKSLAGGFRTKILGPSDESLLTTCCRNQIIFAREKYFEFSLAGVLGNIYGGRQLQKGRRITEGNTCMNICALIFKDLKYF